MPANHFMKKVRIRSAFCLYFPSSELNTERYEASLHIDSKCGKIWTRKTPNSDAFHAVKITHKSLLSVSNLPYKFANTCLRYLYDSDL